MDNSFLTKIKSKVKSLETKTKDKARVIKSSNVGVNENSKVQRNEDDEQPVKDVVTPVNQKETTATEPNPQEMVEQSSQTQDERDSNYEILTGDDGTILYYKLSKHSRSKKSI
jgi:hypothetical protein